MFELELKSSTLIIMIINPRKRSGRGQGNLKWLRSSIRALFIEVTLLWNVMEWNLFQKK